MNDFNFDKMKNFVAPDEWAEKAKVLPENVKEKQNKTPFVFYRRFLSFAACFLFVCGLSVALFFYFNNDVDIMSETVAETKASEKVDKPPFLLQANSGDDSVPQQNEPQSPFENGENVPEDFEFSTGNVCTANFSQGLLVGDKQIYCVLYDYKTGELMGDENLLDEEHLAEIECLDDGTVNATYDPLKNKVVKRPGEYWYVFYNELIMSPIQGYIYIYI